MTEALYLHGINLIPGIGRKTLTKALSRNILPSKLWNAHPRNFSHVFSEKKMQILLAGRSTISLLDEAKKLSDLQSSLVSILDTTFPRQLLEIPDPPHLLYIKGNAEFDFNSSIAIVGTRKFSEYGKRSAELFSAAAARNSITIISGLARGIDGIAHMSALSHNCQTIAVLGSGFNYIYPLAHKSLSEEIIAAGGALVSEYPPDTSPQPGLFPERNRIVAGLSKSTLVIEAPLKSGSIITADLALGYNRDVFTIPGNIFSKNYEGNHKLLADGAKLISCPEDILEEYGIEESEPDMYTAKTTTEKRILECLKINGSIHSDILSMQTKLSFQEIQKALSILEINGIISKDRQGNIFLITQNA